VIHAFLWFVRSFVSVLRGGRHRTLIAGQYVVVKFQPMNRVLYVALLVSFLGLTFTGLPLKYSSQHWAQVFVEGLGGFESTSVWHKFFGAAGIFCCVVHLVRGTISVRNRRKQGMPWHQILFGPDSPVPGFRDLKDLFGMARWFLGLGPKPAFERWTYWEKWDYWMACLACVLVGTSGLMMWYPNLFCRFMSGETLNVARVIHVELALMSTSFLFVFHFFHTHFRPEKFPMDLSAITGLVSESHLRENRPSYVARLEETNLMGIMRRPAPSGRHIWLSFFAGVTLFSVGICLLVVALSAALGK
jgi:cytochrome b subunit of formate dehydrogenase